MMGYGLECGLKAVICKTLNIPTYPDSTGQEKVDNFFKTHNFTQLLIASGMQGILGASGPVKVFENWSAFTFEYPPNWTEMRYDAQRLWSEKKVRNLYKNLVSSRSSIMKEVRKKW